MTAQFAELGEARKRSVNLDVLASEVADLARKGTKVARRGASAEELGKSRSAPDASSAFVRFSARFVWTVGNRHGRCIEHVR